MRKLNLSRVSPSRRRGSAGTNKLRISEREALFLLVILPPVLLVVDSVTGALALSGMSSPLSLFAKSLVLIWLLIICVRMDPAGAFKPFSLIAFVFFLNLYHQFDASGSKHWISGLAWALRFCLIVLTAVVCKEVVEHGRHRLAWVGIGGLISLLVIVINLVFGLAGFGYAQYGGAYGTSGFFVAGNELAVALICASALALGYAYSAGRPFRFWIIFLLFAASALVSLTKAAILSVFILLLALPCLAMFHVIKRDHRLTDSRSLAFGFGSLAGVFALPLAAAAYINVSGFIDRLRFFFDLDGLVGLVFSGRQRFVEHALGTFFEQSSVLDILFGKGVGWVLDVIGHQIEVDPVDFLVAFGVVGVLGAYALVIYFLLGPFKVRNSYSYRSTASDFAWLCGALILGISFFAGHVLNSGLACVLFGLVLGVARAQIPRATLKERAVALPIQPGGKRSEC